MTVNSAFPLLRALLVEPANIMTFQGLDTSLSKARQESMLCLEQLLSAADMTDAEGAEWVLEQHREQLIGCEDNAQYPDYPIIAMFCKANFKQRPLTCLMLMSHGHTSYWTDPRVSQETTPVYHLILKTLPSSPALVHSIVKFCQVEYELESWKNRQCAHVLTLMGMANSCIQQCQSIDNAQLLEDKNALSQLLNQYSSQEKSLLTLLTERMENAKKWALRPDADLEALRRWVDKEVNPLFGIIRDHAHEHSIHGRSHFDFFTEIYDLLNLVTHNKQVNHYLGQAFELDQVVSLLLAQFSKDHQELTKHFNKFGSALSAKEQEYLGDNIQLVGQKMRPLCADHELKAVAYTNLSIALCNWLGRCSFQWDLTPAFREQALGAFFEEEALPDVLKGLSHDGLTLMSGYVMTHHRHLNRQIPRAQRGDYLTDAMGL
jgi:hypothetical protein